MPGFKVVKSTREVALEKLPTSSLTASVGDVLELTAGSTTWAKVTSSSDHFTRKAIVMEAATSASSILCQEVYASDGVVAESANNSNTSHNGDRMAFTDENTVNNSGSDVTGQAVGFVQDGTVGATTDKLIYGKILVGSGVDPDAA